MRPTGWSVYYSCKRDSVVYYAGDGTNEIYISSDLSYTDINQRTLVYSMRKDDNTVIHREGGGPRGEGSSSVPVAIAVYFFTIGASSSVGIYEANLEDVIYEIIVYDSALSDADWQSVER